MTSVNHKNKIKEIRNYFERKGWKCSNEVPIIRNNEEIVKNNIGKIDLCCQKFISLFCFEVENGNQFQTIKNSRDLDEMGKLAKQKRMNYKRCHLGSHEDWRKVCK